MRKVLLLNPSRCTGCKLCELSCSWEKESVFNPHKARIKVVSWNKEGISVPINCMHCQDPYCKAVCMVGAIDKDEETGAVIIDHDICTGCKLCMIACPYGAIKMDIDTGEIIKCDLCSGDPKCVKFCRTKALQWLSLEKANTTLKTPVAEKLAKLSRS